MTRGSSGGRAGRPAPTGRVLSGGLLSRRLVGHRGPEKAGELARDGDVGDGAAFAVGGQVLVAAVQADLGLPGAIARRRAGARAPRSVAVVPGRFDEQPAGVAVAGLGDVA